MSHDSQLPSHVPIMSDDPFSDEILANPYDFHERLREAGPVVYLEKYGIYAMGRYQEVYDSLTDWETFVSSRGAGLSDFKKEKPWRPPSLLLESDPPDHTIVRKALGDVIGPRSIRVLRETFEAEAEVVVDGLLAKGTIDAVTDLAEVYPLKVFPDAVGIREDGRENLLPYGALAFNAFGPHNEILQNALATAGPVQEWINGSCGREVLSETGFGASIWAAADRGEITEEQAPLLVRSLLTAGVDTTVYGITNMLYSMVTHPDQWDALHADPSMAKFAFDEALRFESPVQTFFRTSSRESVVSGVTIPADVKVLLFLGSANRDRRKWGDDAATYDITRQSSGHVAFGMGVHQCVGQPIARLEVESVMTALARRVRSIRPAGTPTPQLNNTLKGWSSVPIELIPA
jgi:cytochrome P450